MTERKNHKKRKKRKGKGKRKRKIRRNKRKIESEKEVEKRNWEECDKKYKWAVRSIPGKSVGEI